MRTDWQLQEKNNKKFYQLKFQDQSTDNLIFIFTTRNIGQNITEIQNYFDIVKINCLHQVHSDKIYYLSDNNSYTYQWDGDGLYTDKENVFLSVKVADCLPIYFFSLEKRIIGIVHSGWRGTLLEIGCKMAQAMKNKAHLQFHNIYFAFGPSINSCCYEINQDLVKLFEQFFEQNKIDSSIIRRENKIYLNLKKTNQSILENLGLRKISDLDLCTYCHEDLFYSSRRDRTYNRNYAIIGYKS